MLASSNYHILSQCYFIRYSWRSQLVEFGGDSYYAVAMDMTGYGGSSKPTEVSRYAALEIAEDVKEVVVELGYSKCILVGHDFGAAISFAVASSKFLLVRLRIKLSGFEKSEKKSETTIIFRCRNSYIPRF